jgi:hypothetical protein
MKDIEKEIEEIKEDIKDIKCDLTQTQAMLCMLVTELSRKKLIDTPIDEIIDAIESDDKETNLEWKAGKDEDTTWDEAKEWVDSLGDGWRMPTLEELRSLYKDGLGTRNMPPELKTTGWWAWSRETRDETSAWTFFFPNGEDYWLYRNDSTLGRAFVVRSRIALGFPRPNKCDRIRN